MAKTKVQSEKSPLSWAFLVAKKIKKDYSRILGYLFVAAKYFEQGKPKNGLKILDLAHSELDKVKQNPQKITLRVELAKKYFKAGDRKQAKKLLEETLSVLLNLKDDLSRGNAFKQIAEGFFTIHFLDPILGILNQIEESDFDESLFADVYSNVLGLLACGYLHEDETKIASLFSRLENTLNQKVEVRKKIGIEYLADKIYFRLIEECLELSKEAKATQFGDKIKDPLIQANGYLIIGEKYLNLNRGDEARLCLKKSKAAALKMDSSLIQVRILEKIGKLLSQLQEKKEALSVLNEAYKKGKALDNYLNTAEVLVDIAEGFQKAKEPLQATEILKEVLENCDKIQVLYSRAMAVSIAGQKYGRL